MKKPGIIIAFFATIVQYYDYALFGLSAAAITKAYMPSSVESDQFLCFFAILASSVAMRPVGSVIFGYIGDFRGRALVLKLATLIAAISTIMIGLMPLNSYYLMIFSRMTFMMSMAGEIDGARIYVSETVDKKREFFGNGLVTCCSQVGALLAAFAWFMTSAGFLPEYWWRVNFIIGGLLGLVIFGLRSMITETIEYSDANGHADKISASHEIPGQSHYDVVRFQSLKIFVLATLISGCIGGIYQFQIIFFGTYITKMLVLTDHSFVAIMNIVAITSYGIVAVISGHIADCYSASKQIFIGLILIICCLLVSAYFLSIGEYSPILFVITSAVMPLYSVPLQIMLKRIMPTYSRLRVFSLSHSFGSLIFSASVPLICSWIWYVTRMSYAPILYIAFMAGLLLVLRRLDKITRDK